MLHAVKHVSALRGTTGCGRVINLDGDPPQRAVNHTQLAGSLVRYPHNPVIKVGAQGAWDGSGPYRGKTAWRVGHATSPDGLKWTKSGQEPILDVGQPGVWDGGTLMHFEIMFRDTEGQFLFWYAAARTEHGEETTMKIRVGRGFADPARTMQASEP